MKKIMHMYAFGPQIALLFSKNVILALFLFTKCDMTLHQKILGANPCILSYEQGKKLY